MPPGGTCWLPNRMLDAPSRMVVPCFHIPDCHRPRLCTAYYKHAKHGEALQHQHAASTRYCGVWRRTFSRLSHLIVFSVPDPQLHFEGPSFILLPCQSLSRRLVHVGLGPSRRVSRYDPSTKFTQFCILGAFVCVLALPSSKAPR